MAHESQMFFIGSVQKFFPHFFKNKKVLEIGSMDINGTVRVFFEDCEYIGIDVGPGKGVDLICNGDSFGDAAGSYDVVISTEVFEHAERWDLIFLNMLRLCKRDGMIIFTCASLGRPQHGTRLSDPGAAPHISSTTDYYKNLVTKDFMEIVNLNYWFSEYGSFDATTCLFFVGVGNNNTADVETMKNFKNIYQKYLYNSFVLGLPHEYAVKI